ncbi:MAG: 16S rRNA (uracil(1498)-N(3))-methyltransferase [Mycobacteriales bacterium]
MSAPLFFRSCIPEYDEFTLDGPEGHHAATVLRLGPGEALEVTDGCGALAHCVVRQGAAGVLTVLVTERVRQPPPQPWLVAVQALPKGERGELAVELLTEVGVNEILPWAADRSVARWAGERGLRRWRAAAARAAKQSRRAWWPVVADLHSTVEVADRLGRATLRVVLHEAATRPLEPDLAPPVGEVVLVVGPEGGLTDRELELFGGPAYRLGPGVLRTSTAGAVAAGVLLSGTARWRAGLP